MRSLSLRSFLISAALLAALVAAPATAGSRTYFAEGWYVSADTVRYKPRSMWLSGNGTMQLTKMRWSRWNGRQAIGRGTARVNDCEPSCAGGSYHRYRVRIRFFRARQRCGYRLYTRARHTFLRGRPPGAERSTTWNAGPVCGR